MLETFFPLWTDLRVQDISKAAWEIQWSIRTAVSPGLSSCSRYVQVHQLNIFPFGFNLLKGFSFFVGDMFYIIYLCNSQRNQLMEIMCVYTCLNNMFELYTLYWLYQSLSLSICVCVHFLHLLTFTESRGDEPEGWLCESESTQTIPDGQGETEPVRFAEKHRGAGRTGKRWTKS